MREKFLTELYRYFLGKISLVDFQSWLLSNLQEILDSEESVAVEAANSLDSDLVELGERLIDEAEFFRRIGCWIGRLETISANVAAPSVQSGPDPLETINLVVEFPIQREIRLSHSVQFA